MNGRLKQLRRHLNMTQQEFADRIGMKRNTIANYETDRNEPSNSVVTLICREFNVNEEWLRSGEGDMFVLLDREDELAVWSGKLLNPNNDNEFMKKFVHMLSRLDVEDWKVLEKMMLLMQEENKKDQT